MAQMAFGVPQVRDFLKNNGYVLTVRGYDYGHEAATVTGIGRIHRKNLGEITTMDDLKPFITLSGFTDVKDWWKQIKRFCTGKMWLYRVQIDTNTSTKKGRDKERNTLIRQCPEVIEMNRPNTYRDIDDPTPIEEYSIFSGEMNHALDIRHESRDPADIDLQPFRDAAHADRIDREANATQRKHERMRERYQEHGEIKKFVKGT